MQTMIFIGFILGFLYTLMGVTHFSGKFENGISFFDFFKLVISFLLWPLFALVLFLSKK
jgi:hypothetical protein